MNSKYQHLFHATIVKVTLKPTTLVTEGLAKMVRGGKVKHACLLLA